MAAGTGTVLQYTQRQKPSVHIVTTLYDLVEAVAEEVRADEQHLITPVVQDLLQGSRII